jgi:hypothetical protein
VLEIGQLLGVTDAGLKLHVALKEGHCKQNSPGN